MALTGANIQAISELLNPEAAESDSDDDMKPDTSVGALGPGDVGPAKQNNTPETQEKKQKNTKDIWDEEEVPEGAEYEAVYDPRPQPEYEILYKQAVSSEDMFLQMGNKTPLTSSCEDMVVKIHLPGTELSDVDLDVKSKFLDCRSSKFRLGLHLPHPVDHKSGKAQWNSKTDMLHITLRMVRDLDMFNF